MSYLLYRVLSITLLDMRSIAFSLRHVNTKMHDHKACFTALYAIRSIRQVIYFSVFANLPYLGIIIYFTYIIIIAGMLCFVFYVFFLNDFGRKVQIVSFRIYVVFCNLFVV